MAQRWMEFKGTRYEVARQLGYFWGTYFRKRPWLRPRHLLSDKDEHSEERGLLADKCPMLELELQAITDGVNEAGFSANCAGVFGEVLGEAGRACATLAIRSKRSVVLSHNEEWAPKIPLCFARVTVSGKRGTHRFLSVSYPFQFFGSSAGATRRFAFSGNSISLDKAVSKDVEAQRDRRVPKTFVTRLLLDQYSFKDAQRLLGNYHFLQANNLCFVNSRGPCRAQIVPYASLSVRKRSQVTWEVPGDGRLAQTNHLRCNGAVASRTQLDPDDPAWDWGRRNTMESVAMDLTASVGAMEKYLSTKGRVRSTIATISFEVQGDKMFGTALHYFTGRSVRVHRVVV